VNLKGPFNRNQVLNLLNNFSVFMDYNTIDIEYKKDLLLYEVNTLDMLHNKITLCVSNEKKVWIKQQTEGE